MVDNNSTHGIGSATIIINSDGNAATLDDALLCLQYLEGPAFEVCVITGSTDDGTTRILEKWNGLIKVARVAVHNLSARRNIAIALADSPIVAFIDHDGLPEPEWLRQILHAFACPDVAAVGGSVMDHTGSEVRFRYGVANRLARTRSLCGTAASRFCFPYSFNFPYVEGSNAAFRRDALLDIGGFDEEYDLGLDTTDPDLGMTDVCCRLIDAGFLVRQLSNAFVHPRFPPCTVNAGDRSLPERSPVLKNKLYFSMVNNRRHYPVARAIDDMTLFASEEAAKLRSSVGTDCLRRVASETFDRDLARARELGFARGISGERRLISPTLFGSYKSPFLPFPRRMPTDTRETFVFVSQQFPPDRRGDFGPDRLGGIGRHIGEVSRAVAALGHHVHVITAGDGPDRVEFEEGVWIHRTWTRDGFSREQRDIPQNIWNRSCTVLRQLRVIAEKRPVTAVHAPIWDGQAAAVLFDRKFPLVIGLYTPLRTWLEGHPHIAQDTSIQQNYIRPMLKLEELTLRECDAVHADSSAIISEIHEKYGIAFDRSRVDVIHPGMSDWTRLPAVSAGLLPEGSVRILFVGRLERRKGIDVLLGILPMMIAKYPQLYADIVGNDAIASQNGETYRAMFEKEASTEARDRVRFHGEVAEERLRGFYRDCDIVVLPSRFESFGLVVLEAMMFGKPAVACRSSGMMEVAEDGQTALLAAPGNESSLADCLERLIEDPALRHRLGAAGRRRYEATFTPEIMARRVVALMRAACIETSAPKQKS